MRILIADKFEKSGVEGLQALTRDVAVEPGLGDKLKARVAEFKPTVLVVRSTKVTADVLGASDSLKLVIRAGSGYDTIDVAAATARGVSVANTPGMNAVAVAELVMALMLAMDRRIADNVADLRAGEWNKKLYSKARGLKGLTLGVIGAGNIGAEVIRRATSFGMNVLYTYMGRTRILADLPTAQRTELDDLLKHSDVITIHIPGGATTKHLIGEAQLRLMKKTTVLINTSRASVVDEPALIKALKEGWIAGAAVDVYENEPAADAPAITSPLKDLPNLYGTHHIGASTDQAQEAVAAEVVHICKQYQADGRVLHCVNASGGGGGFQLMVRLVNTPGALAHVFQRLTDAKIAVTELDHTIYNAGQEASAYIGLNAQPSADVLKLIRGDGTQVLAADVFATA